MNPIIILHAGLATGTILLFAGIGEIFTERSGILNLGVEGMMLVGAMAGFSISLATQNPWLGVIGCHACCRVDRSGPWGGHHSFSGGSSGERSLFDLSRNRAGAGAGSRADRSEPPANPRTSIFPCWCQSLGLVRFFLRITASWFI